MTNYFLKQKLQNQRGATIVIVAVILPLLLGMAALAIDIGYVYATKNELQNVADAAALAAAGELGYIYQGLSSEEQLSYFCDPTTIKAIAVNIAEKNTAAGVSISINSDDIIIGKWESAQSTGDKFTPTLYSPDAVRVKSRRDDLANGPITTFFASIFKVFGATDPEIVSVDAVATAALMGPNIAYENSLPIPVGIPKYRFESEYCDNDIKFHPTGDFEGCAGWHTYDSSPANASKLKDILEGLRTGTFVSPETVAGTSVFVFTGGTVASAFDNMQSLYDAKKNSDGEWTTEIIVYDDEGEGCANPNQTKLIIGFASVTIKEILGPPDKTIKATINCDMFIKGRGNGPYFGTKGTIPGLVE